MADGPVRKAVYEALASSPEVPAALLVELNGGRRPAPEDVSRLTERGRVAMRQQAAARVRARAVLDAARAVKARTGRVVASVPGGTDVEFESILPAPGYPEGTAVIVRPFGAPVNGDGDVIIVNPPVLIPHPEGETVLGSGRHHEDPLAAIAQVVANVYGKGS